MRPVQSFLERGVQKVRGKKKVPTSKGRWSSADPKKRSLLKLLPKELCGSSVYKGKKKEKKKRSSISKGGGVDAIAPIAPLGHACEDYLKTTVCTSNATFYCTFLNFTTKSAMQRLKIF